MLSKKMLDMLNKQINLEFYSSNIYLQMSSWCDNQGLPGTAKFLRGHADEEMMARHDISTDVFDTYVDDFHGTTIELFDPEQTNALPTTAVCYDCHGIHDIHKPDDPEAGIKENLLETCQKCHPDATANFPDAWTSHFEPSLENNTLIYLVNLFYQLVIPVTLSILAFLVFTDVYRLLRERLGAPEGEDES